MVGTRNTKKKTAAKKGSPNSKKRSTSPSNASQVMAAAGVGSPAPSISGATANGSSVSKELSASVPATASSLTLLNDQKPSAVPSANEIVLRAGTDDADEPAPSLEAMSEENRAILKVTRFIPNGLDLVSDGSKWYLVVMGQVYSIDVHFNAVLEIAKDWYIKANREDSSLDAESVVITVCDAFEEALTNAQNSGATQYVRPEQAPGIYPPAIEKTIEPAGSAAKSDVVTLNQVTLSALSETGNPHLRGSPPKSAGLTVADIQRSAVTGAIASNYPAPVTAVYNPYATPPR
jgi:hypothetical protein